jgi:hypothetical protein
VDTASVRAAYDTFLRELWPARVNGERCSPDAICENLQVAPILARFTRFRRYQQWSRNEPVGTPPSTMRQGSEPKLALQTWTFPLYFKRKITNQHPHGVRMNRVNLFPTDRIPLCWYSPCLTKRADLSWRTESAEDTRVSHVSGAFDRGITRPAVSFPFIYHFAPAPRRYSI